MREYNKLVRDNIPEIIRAQGNIPETRKLGEDEYARALDEKLQEEVREFLESHAPEELADILEVLLALAARLGIPREELEALRLQKYAERGGFAEQTLLIRVR